jgi:transcriptional regulator with XRE-family HTH domain
MSNLKRIRSERGLSQSQLAELSGVNFRILQYYEQGARDIDGAKLDTLIKLATALDCPVSDILENEELREKSKKARL